MRDFTKAQAKRWVAQELRRHETPESARERIEQEKRLNLLLADELEELDAQCPNSKWAHEELVRRLQLIVSG